MTTERWKRKTLVDSVSILISSFKSAWKSEDNESGRQKYHQYEEEQESHDFQM